VVVLCNGGGPVLSEGQCERLSQLVVLVLQSPDAFGRGLQTSE
jgi:hypothetical protein